MLIEEEPDQDVVGLDLIHNSRLNLNKIPKYVSSTLSGSKLITPVVQRVPYMAESRKQLQFSRSTMKEFNISAEDVRDLSNESGRHQVDFVA